MMTDTDMYVMSTKIYSNTAELLVAQMPLRGYWQIIEQHYFGLRCNE